MQKLNPCKGSVIIAEANKILPLIIRLYRKGLKIGVDFYEGLSSPLA